MSTTKQITTTISKFTPCPDALVEKYSHTTALVWGKIWRYCQMKDEVCKASIQRLADELGLSDVTIGKHIKLLEDGGYIKDLTPNLKNKPHEYIDTEKLKLKISLFMEDEEEKPTAKKFGSDYQESWHEESTPNGSGNATDIFSIYQNNIAMLTPMMADTLKDAEKIYPSEWIVEAFALAVENNKRNWRYCEAILKRWKADGKDEGKGKPVLAEPPRPEHQRVNPDENRGKYVPNHLPRPNIRRAATASD